MNVARNRLSVLFLLLALLVPSVGRGGTLPAWYPASFMALGEVQEVNSTAYTFTIEALSYRYTAAIRVHTLTKENDYISRIQPGMKVGFSFSGSGVSRTITEIWEIPSNVEIPRL